MSSFLQLGKSILLNFFINFNLKILILKILHKLKIVSNETMLELSLVKRPEYSFGVLSAAKEAKALGYEKITVIEFGVAGGNGLIALEGIAIQVSKYVNIQIDVLGFDMGIGMPSPTDYRDVPYMWTSGFYKMDEELLRSKLTISQLVIGDLGEVSKRAETYLCEDSPIGFCAFDLDYYSSTKAALNGFFRLDDRFHLPRTWLYFDDLTRVSPFAGENLAINEFNFENSLLKIGRPGGLRETIPFKPYFGDCFFVLHDFMHKSYNQILNSDEQLPLK